MLVMADVEIFSGSFGLDWPFRLKEMFRLRWSRDTPGRRPQER